MDRGKSEEVKSGEEWAEVGGLLVTQGRGDVWAWAAAEAHVWNHGPVAAVVCVDVLSS